MTGNTSTKNQKVINELKSRVVNVRYGEAGAVKSTKLEKLDKAVLWRKAQKVGRHLNDDSLSSAAPTRP